MGTTASVITCATEMANFEKDLTPFLNSCSTNPFLQYPFIIHIMTKIPPDSSPLILVIKDDEKIIGVAPLVLKQRFGLRRVASLLKHTGSPDIVAKAEYRSDVLKHVLFVLLKRMHCKSITLTLPAESENLNALESECSLNGVTFFESREQTINHCVILVNCSWQDFQKSLSSNQRRKLNQTQRRLSSIGQWKITFTETTNDDQAANETLNKIHVVEKNSWKENWRFQNGESQDRDLEGMWKTSRVLTKTNPDFKTMIWMLELNNNPVAYTLAIWFKDTALLAKTAYSNKYARLSLGVYLIHAVIQDLFNKNGVQKIDFMTDLPFMKTWHPTIVSRVRLKIVAGDLPMLNYAIKNSRIRRTVYRMPVLSVFLP
jgi:CelD/BcsL family acetyltransferase involved in cellulose biosynthesis